MNLRLKDVLLSLLKLYSVESEEVQRDVAPRLCSLLEGTQFLEAAVSWVRWERGDFVAAKIYEWLSYL